MIGLKYLFVYDKLYQSVLNASFEEDDGASLGEDPTGVVPYFYPTYTPTETKVFLTGQLAGLLQVGEAVQGERVSRVSLVNDEVLVWHFPRCLLVMSYEGQLPVEALEDHFFPLAETAAYFYLCHIVNNPPPASVPIKNDSDLGYYDLPTNSTEDEPDRSCEVFMPEIYSESTTDEEEVKEETAAFECVEPMKLTSAEKAALEGFVFLLANLLQNLCSTLRPEMTLLNLSKHGNDVFVESQQLLAEIRRDFEANGGAIFFNKQLVTSTLGVEMTKLVALVDLNAGVPAEVVVPVDNSAGNRLGVYRVWVREEPTSVCDFDLEPRKQSSVHSSPEKISVSTLRAMSKTNGSSSANYWKLLKRAERRRIKQATAVQRRLEFEEKQASLRRAEDLGSFEDIPLSVACSGESEDEVAEEVELDGVEKDQESDGEEDEHVKHNPAFLITYRLSDMEVFFLAETMPKHLNKLAEVLHKNLVKLEGYIWCRVRLSAAGNGVKPSGFGWFQWDHQWGSAIQEGRVGPAQRDALQLVHRQISSQKNPDEDESDEDDDTVQEMVCRSGQEMIYARRSTTRDLFYWSECPVLRTGAPCATSTLAEFPEKARKHLKRLIM